MKKYLNKNKTNKLKSYIHYFIKHKEKIIDRWVNINEVINVLTNHDISIKKFKKKYALKVINNFIN